MDFSAFHNQHDSRLHELIYLSILDEFHSQHEEGRRKVGSLTSKTRKSIALERDKGGCASRGKLELHRPEIRRLRDLRLLSNL